MDWSPDAKQILATDVRFHNDVYATHLIVYTIDTGISIDLSEQESAEDTLAAWSPDGEWLAVVRRLPSNTQSNPGDNLWLIRPDGSDAQPVTTREGAFHGRPVWAPDSIHLVYHVYTVTKENFQSEIWMLNIITQDEQKLTDQGSRPDWIP